MASGITRYQPLSTRGTNGMMIAIPTAGQEEAGADDGGGAPVTGPLAGDQGRREHGQRQGCQRQAGFQGVVLEGHLEEQRQRDHGPAQGDLLQHLTRDAGGEVRMPEQVRVEQRDLLLALAPDQPPGQRHQRDCPDSHEQADELAALLPDQDPEHHAAHADDRQDRADDVDLAGAGVRDVTHQPDLAQHDGDDQHLQAEADPPRQVGRDEPAEQRTDGGGDGGRGTDQRVGLLLGSAREVAVDQRLHRRQEQRGAESAEDRPEDDDRGQALGQRHGQRPECVGQQSEDIGPLPADQVAHLAVDQDERRRDQRLESDGGLDAAGGRVQVLDDRGDRHVHQRRVDHQHEHGRRQQQHQAAIPRAFRFTSFGGSGTHVALSAHGSARSRSELASRRQFAWLSWSRRTFPVRVRGSTSWKTPGLRPLRRRQVLARVRRELGF